MRKEEDGISYVLLQSESCNLEVIENNLRLLIFFPSIIVFIIVYLLKVLGLTSTNEEFGALNKFITALSEALLKDTPKEQVSILFY